MPEPGPETSTDIAERVQSILASKGLTLSRVSQRSEARYGRSSAYFVPHNLYHDLRVSTFSPSVYQIFALSQISGYRLSDWLRLFGFHPDDILRLQVRLPCNRTILLDPSVEDSNAWVPWFDNRSADLDVPATAPLSQLLKLASHRRLHSLSETNRGSFLYTKIGRWDALAFPDLLPGSIVRINPATAQDLLPRKNGETSHRMFLLQWGENIYCTRLRCINGSWIMPISNEPGEQVELRFGRETRLLGFADFEVRSLLSIERSDNPAEFHKAFVSKPLSSGPGLSHLLRAARGRMDLSFRQASSISQKVAGALGDHRYFVSPSSLSDFEARDIAPRHVHKIITLCAVYAVSFFTFLRTAGIVLEEEGQESMPDHFLRRTRPADFHGFENKTDEVEVGGFLGELVSQFGEIPFFLRRSLDSLSGLKAPSLNDFFWIGGERNALHPDLINGVLVIVNRRKKKPSYFVSRPAWQQPIYLVRKRNSTYLCGCCGLEDGVLSVHDYRRYLHTQERLRNHDDAEVVGQVVTIARKLA